jgi:uncharacterized phage protein (TIGR01671 family)
MNRKIEFRGKLSHSGEWVFGSLLKIDSKYHIVTESDMYEDGHHICQESDTPTWVDPYTVGQFTGLTDKNGVKIFEGDIVRKRDLTFGIKFDGVVVYNSEIGCFRIHSENNGVTMRMGFEASDVYNDGKCTVPVKYDYEVIGNIHNNPELLATR